MTFVQYTEKDYEKSSTELFEICTLQYLHSTIHEFTILQRNIENKLRKFKLNSQQNIQYPGKISKISMKTTGTEQ